jgi:hypothetical protein
VLHLEHNIEWGWHLDTSESRWDSPGKFWNLMLENDGKAQLDRSCEKWRSITQSRGGKEHSVHSKK